VFQILTLSGGFLVLVALYEMFEYAFCYGEEKASFAAELRSRAEEMRPARESNASAVAHESLDSNDDESTESTQLLLGEAIPMELYRTSNENSTSDCQQLFASPDDSVNARITHSEDEESGFL
jgi:hypothetical protein